MQITSLNNEKVKYYSKLMINKRQRDKEKLFIVEGEHLVEEAIKEQIVKEIMISDMRYDKDFEFNKVYITDEIMKKICNTITPQGIIALCIQKEIVELDEYKRILLLDNIQDPGNLGTIIRSADAFNFDGIVANLNTVDIYNPKVVRSTQGAIFRVKYIKKDLLDYIKHLKDNDVKIYGTALEGVNLSSVETKEKMAFIMGNEGNGVSKELLRETNSNIFIEMSGQSESLNVGVASSILMYYFRKS